MSVSPSPDAGADFVILSSVHQDGLAKNVAESVHPRLGGSARVVGVRGRPSPRSGSDDDENRAPSWYPQVPLITTIAEPTGVGSITGRRSKRAYPPDFSHDAASLQQQPFPGSSRRAMPLLLGLASLVRLGASTKTKTVSVPLG